MEALLAARSYKREIILTTADSGHLELLFNLLLDFHELSMTHTVVLMDTEAACNSASALAAHFNLSLGCAWTSFLQHDHPELYWTKSMHMWLLRWLLFNSMVRRGYNVLILDTDTSIRMDPYFFLKSPPFSQYNQIVQYDDNAPEINCGLQYGQNIESDGPLAWITAEVVDRMLRCCRLPWQCAGRHAHCKL